MDTEQWLECEMWLMRPYISLNASERKQRLLAVAFCRHISHLISEARCRTLLKWAKTLSAFGDDPIPKRPSCLLHAIDEAERCADGLIPIEEFAAASNVADRLSFVEEYHYACYVESWGPRDFKLFASSVAARAVYYATCPRVDIEEVQQQAARAVHRSTGSEENKEDPDEELAQCELVRDLFPNPDCSYEWQPKWSSPKVVELAQSIYQRKAFEDLPKLGRALGKAGCQDQTVLAHCKSPRQHVRGCWVIDAALFKN
jgi:hypothetical protein